MRQHPLVAWLCLASLPVVAAQDVAPAPESLSPLQLSRDSAALASRGRDIEGGRLYVDSRTEQREGRLLKTFTLEVERAGDYFVAAHAQAVNAVPADAREAKAKAYPLQRISVSLDGKDLGDLDLKKNGWQPSRIQGQGRVYFSAGRHTLTFESAAPHFPDVDAVKLVANEGQATFDMGLFDEYVSGLRRGADLRVGRKDKVEPVAPPQGPPPSTGPIQGAASTGSYTWQVTPYTLSNPNGNYAHLMTVPVVYTYYRKLTLNAGTSVTFNTAPIAGQDYYAVDPVMYLFCSTDNTVAWSNDDDIGRHPKISVSIPKTCEYNLVLRAYSSYYAGTSTGSAGTVNVYQNGVLLQENAVVSGYMVSVGTSNTGTLNYFTGYSTGLPMLWLAPEGNLTPMRFSGGRYWYLPPMDYNWFDDARFRIVKNTTSFMNMYLLVSAEGAWYIYWGNADVYGSVKHPSSSPFNSFPNLKQADGMQTAPSTNTYNCASWAGGLTNGWYWGCLYANNSGGACINGTYYSNPYSWYSWDNFFGNNPLRYTGALTYTRTDANSSNAEIAVWSTSSDIYGATHFSVRREANRNPHGYDWESKPGGLERIFHPMNALNSTSYGSIIGYYRDAARDPYTPWPLVPGLSGMEKVSTPSLTFDESVAAGLTVVPHVELTRSEADTLAQLRAGAGKARPQLDRLYNDWLARVRSEDLRVFSNPAVFFEQREFSKLESWFRNHEDVAVPFLMEKVVASEEDGLESTLAALVLGRLTGERDGALMDEVKQDWRRDSYTADGAYVAPSSLANSKNFVRKLLQRRYGVADERASLAPRAENSHERFSVSPNPMVESSSVRFRVDSAATVSAALYDAKGSLVRELASGAYPAGTHGLELGRGALKPGVYSLRLTVGDEVLTRKVAIQ
ncbi:T9SS type A sorting domain-containing protein [Pyxidicoccus sp. MSG2]|uniref:T9SS type A sorting domain-containing protein n=1 Tax=Pyxidicoccus sp. MSG2 TaxID=2996790 RepID=UPI00226DB0E1|nr:T9SS type A sorting domain-containing protein [Pyxidicoccus sp. MSG2]MCY1018650.1 T9SS type A sorting domain-containing protein [Pyxidicoccus sp. MSG2]